MFDDFLHLENVHLISEHVQLILDFMLIETPFEAINISGEMKSQWYDWQSGKAHN